jgi:hypothetical protein
VGEIAAIYDCESTDIFQVIDGTTANKIVHKDGTSSPGNNSKSLSRAYQQNQYYIDNQAADSPGNTAMAFVTGVDAVRYYIANDPVTNLPGLWRQYYDGTGIVQQQLVDGIENMQILYGSDSAVITPPSTVPSFDGNPDDYRTADKVLNWNYVIAAKVTLLVSTADEYGTETERDENTYDIYGTPGDPSDDLPAPMDRRQRKLVSITVLLRNMQARLAEET